MVVAHIGEWSIANIAIAAVITLGIIALVFIAAKAMKVPIPEWVIHALGVVFVVFVIVLLIRFIAGI